MRVTPSQKHASARKLIEEIAFLAGQLVDEFWTGFEKRQSVGKILQSL